MTVQLPDLKTVVSQLTEAELTVYAIIGTDTAVSPWRTVAAPPRQPLPLL